MNTGWLPLSLLVLLTYQKLTHSNAKLQKCIWEVKREMILSVLVWQFRNTLFPFQQKHLSLRPLIITDKEFAIVFIACILYFITSENLLISSYIIYFVRNNLEENQISKREKRKTTVHTEHFECKNWKPDLKNDQNRKPKTPMPPLK